MWNVMGANRLLQQRSRRQNYDKHRKTLAEIRPQIDNLPPQHYGFLTTRLKARQQASDLSMNVMANNQDLVRRMMRPKSGVKSANKKSSKGSLHATYFKLVAAQIDDENRKLLSRLQETTPFVRVQQLESEHKKHLRWKQAHRRQICEMEGVRPLSAR